MDTRLEVKESQHHPVKKPLETEPISGLKFREQSSNVNEDLPVSSNRHVAARKLGDCANCKKKRCCLMLELC